MIHLLTCAVKFLTLFFFSTKAVISRCITSINIGEKLALSIFYYKNGKFISSQRP